MRFSVGPLMGVGVGIEFTEQVHDKRLIHYCLIDVLILRFQLAWYGKEFELL